MSWLGIWQGCEYARVTEGCEYVWICFINASVYILIMLNMLEYVWIYLNKLSCEYLRVLNMSDAVHGTMSLYKLPRSYWERRIQNTVKHLRQSIMQKEYCLSVAEYASMSLNIHKYPWKCLNKLFWLCQGSKYAWSSYMLNKLLKMPQILNMPWLHKQELHRVLSISENGTICLNNAWMTSI